MEKLKSIAIVIPVFNEAQNVPHLLARLEQITSKLSAYMWQYIFVNDGSSDGSWAVLQKIAHHNPNITALDLSRNFGKEIALTAGVHEADADAVICMDADLQHPPELIPKLVTAWENGAEIVSTCRQSIERQPLLRRIGSHVFYWIMNKVSSVKMVSQTTDYRLFDKKVVTVFNKVTEQGRMFRGILDWMGFRCVVVDFHADERQAGVAGYSYRKLVKLAMDALTSFSLFPLRIIGYLGGFISIFSGGLLCAMLITRFFINKTTFSALAFVAVGNTFLMGVVLIGIGLAALYIGKIHIEVLGRPLYIVRERLSNQHMWEDLVHSPLSLQKNTHPED